MLVVALHYCLVDGSAGDLPDAATAVDQQLQFVFLVEPLHLAGRIVQIIPGPGFVAVGKENERTLPLHTFQTVSIQLGLLLADAGVLPGPLGFDHRQRQAVVAPQDVIDKAPPFGSAQGKPFFLLAGQRLLAERSRSQWFTDLRRCW